MQAAKRRKNTSGLGRLEVVGHSTILKVLDFLSRPELMCVSLTSKTFRSLSFAPELFAWSYARITAKAPGKTNAEILAKTCMKNLKYLEISFEEFCDDKMLEELLSIVHNFPERFFGLDVLTFRAACSFPQVEAFLAAQQSKPRFVSFLDTTEGPYNSFAGITNLFSERLLCLNLAYVQISVVEFQTLQNNCPNLKSLSFEGVLCKAEDDCEGLIERCLYWHYPNHTKLSSLVLKYPEVDVVDVNQLLHLPKNCVSLTLSNIPLQFVQLEKLCKIKGLRVLKLLGLCGVTREDLLAVMLTEEFDIEELYCEEAELSFKDALRLCSAQPAISFLGFKLRPYSTFDVNLKSRFKLSRNITFGISNYEGLESSVDLGETVRVTSWETNIPLDDICTGIEINRGSDTPASFNLLHNSRQSSPVPLPLPLLVK